MLVTRRRSSIERLVNRKKRGTELRPQIGFTQLERKTQLEHKTKPTPRVSRIGAQITSFNFLNSSSAPG
jgi:hypothetical protein